MLNKIYQPERKGLKGKIKGGDTEYFAFEALNCSWLKKWKKSEKHFQANVPIVKTKSMEMGTSYHKIMLEDFWETHRLFIKPVDATMNNKINKQAWIDFQEEGYKSLTEKELEDLEGMKASTNKNPFWSKVKDKEGLNEQGFYFVHESGIICKIKPDSIKFMSNGSILPIDLKKTTSASPQLVKRDFTKYDYPLQAAYYSLILSKIYPDNPIQPFHFLMCESGPPYLSQHYVIDTWEIGLIQEWIEKTLWAIADKIKNELPFAGYSEGIEPVLMELPEYYLNNFY